MNQHRFTSVRIAAGWAMALGLVAVMLFASVSPALAANGGVSIVSVTVGGPSGSATYGTPGDISYLVTATCGGTGGGGTWAPIVTSALPAGVTASFSPTPLVWANNCGNSPSQNSTLTLHTTAATPGGVTSVTVQVGASSGPASLTVHGIQLTVQGFNAQNKPYDGNTIAIPVLSGVSLSTGVIYPDQVFLDSSNVHGTFASRTVGSNKLVTASGFALTGLNASNYTLVQPTTFANITQADLHVFINSVQSKVYDGTTAAVVTLTTDAVGGDTVTATGIGSFDNKNAGLNKLVTVPFVSLSGPDAGNYNPVTTTASAQANISQRALTVTAAASTKQYDGSTSSAATPLITSGSLQGGDTAGFIETFDSKNVGSGKILTASGGVSDGNGGNNYAVTFVSNSNGVIIARPLTVSALGDNKTYDGTTAATVGLSDDRAFGDFVVDSYTGAAFIDKNVGNGKGINVSGISISGLDAGNYTLANTSASTTGNIGARSITVIATSNTKGYDGTLSASAIPSISSGSLGSGDVAGFSEAYFDKNAGTGKTLVPSGSVSDGNGGNNYSVSFASDATGVIQPRVVHTVTADNQGILATDALPSFTFKYGLGDVVAGDTIATPPTCGVSVTAPAAAGSYPITCSGGADPNYDFSATSYVDGVLLVTGVNDPPIDIFLDGSNNSSPVTPFEFQRAGGLIGMLTDQDPNGGDVATYSLVDSLSCSGADNGIFQIGGSAQDELRINDSVPGGYALDYETQPVLHFCIQAKDSHDATLDKAFTVNVQNRVGVKVIYASQAANDGFVLESALPANAGKGGTANGLGGSLNVGDTKAGKQYRSVLSFNTALLPDNAVLTKVTLKMRLQKKVGNITGLGNLVFDVKQPYFGTLAALQAGDFQNVPSLPALASAAPSCGDPGCTWYSFDLNPAALTTDATRKSTTQIRVEFANPTNNTPTSQLADMLQFYSGNATVVGNRPQLIIEYSLPSVTATLTSIAAQDGQVMESPALNNVGGSFNATGTAMQVGDNKLNQEIKSILSFNTDVLPDRAIITGIQLKIKRAGVIGDPFANLGNLSIDVKQPFFGGGNALQLADFASPADHGAAGTISASDLVDGSNWYTINLDPSAFSALTPKVLSQLRLNFASQLSGDGAAEALRFYTSNSVAANRPVLVITFSIP